MRRVLALMVFYEVGSLAEAQALADADPAVKAGRHVAEIHPWLVSRGARSR